jgi:hypothetical protein
MVAACIPTPRSSTEVGVMAVTQPCSPRGRRQPKAFCGQIEREVGGWWATLDSNQ